VLNELTKRADPANLAGMARFGIAVEKRLGVSVPDMRQVAKAIGRDHRPALQLWKTGIAEVRIVASMIDMPDEVTWQQANRWVITFNSWDVCDQVCQNLFAKTQWVWRAVQEWSAHDEEFVKRAAFALLAWPGMTSKPPIGNSSSFSLFSNRVPVTSGISSRKRSIGPYAI